MPNQIEHIKEGILTYKRTFFRNELLKGILICVLFLFAVYLTTTSIEFWGHFSSSVRSFLFFGLIAISLLLIGFLIIKPLISFLEAKQKMSDEEAAQQLGVFFPTIKDKLVNIIQLDKLDYQQSELILASINQKSSQVQGLNFTQAIDTSDVKKYTKYLLAFLAFMLLLFFLNRDVFTKGTQRIIQYNKQFAIPAPFNFEMLNPSFTVNRNDDFTFLLKLSGNTIPEEAKIVINEKSYSMRKEEGNTFSFQLNNVRSEKDFYFSASGYTSASNTLHVVDQAELKGIKINVRFPSYQKRAAQSYENTGSISVPEGSKVSWEIQASNTDQVSLKFDTKIEQTSTEDNQVFTYKKTIREATDYQIIYDTKETTNSKYHIQVTKDEFPTIQVSEFKDTLLSNSVFFSGEIGDDYGFSKLSLLYTVTAENGKSSTKEKVLLDKINGKSQPINYHLELDSLGIKQGEALSYSLAIWDNDAVNGPKKTTSQTFSLSLPSAEQLNSMIAKAEKNNSDQLSDMQRELAKLQEDLKKAQAKLKGKKQLDWQDKKTIENIINKQKELQKQVDQLQDNIEKNQLQKTKTNEQKSQESNLIQQMANDIKDEETQKILKELEKLLQDKKKINELNDKLDKLDKRNELSKNNIARTKEMYKQLLFKEKLDNLINKTEELAEEQKELAEQENDKSDVSELKEKQDKINEKFNNINKEIEKLEELNRDLERPNSLIDTKEERMSIKEEIDKASESLKNNDRKKSKAEQKKASEKMDSLNDKLQGMQAKMQQKVLQENIETLKIILDNLLKLSFSQEEVMTNLSGVSTRDPIFLEYSQKQVQLNNNAEVVEDSLIALAKRSEQIQKMVLEETQKFTEYMDESLLAIKQRNKRNIVTKQQYAMTSMNNLALLLSDILSNMQMSMSSMPTDGTPQPQPGGKEKGQKPSGEGSSEGLGDSQKKINEGIQKLSKGQKGGRELAEEIAKLAAEQEKIRQALKELENQAEPGSSLKKDLSKLQELMDQTEKDLVFKKLNSQTIRRQQEILTRLLEAEKASKEQSLDNKREAEEGSNLSRKYPPEIEKYLKEKQRQVEQFQSITPELTPFYQKKVSEYFKRMDN